jgi:uroporphyrinogen decarboxylase
MSHSIAIPERPGAIELAQSQFLRACRRQPVDYTPIWLMRQAGRYMPEYRAIRERYSMLEVIRTPELAAQVTLQPIDAFQFDAAIIFSDILPPLIGMGLELDFVKGEGPVISNPLSSTRQIDLLATPPATETMAGTLQAISLVSNELKSRGVPLIGFAGAPFTLACYAIQGSGSKLYEKAKRMMYSEPAAWKRLMDKLVTVVADYLIAQAKHGASALQVFDSWSGILSPNDYERFALPYNRQLFEKISTANVPTINFSTCTGSYLSTVATSGGDVIGVDWRLSLDEAWRAIGYDRAIQGNLDPTALLGPIREIKVQVDAILNGAAGKPGHIFNLGHGILPETPPDTVRWLVDYVRQQTTSQSASENA